MLPSQELRLSKIHCVRACVHTDLRPNHRTNAGKHNREVGTYTILCVGETLQYTCKNHTGEAITHIKSVHKRDMGTSASELRAVAK